MLNKPTNVSPYNKFIDINNGLNIDFTLNNVVDRVDIGIYKDDNTFIAKNLIDNNAMKRDFSYAVQESVRLNSK